MNDKRIADAAASKLRTIMNPTDCFPVLTNVFFIALYGFCIKALYTDNTELIAWALLFVIGFIGFTSFVKEMLFTPVSFDDNKTFLFFIPDGVREYIRLRTMLNVKLSILVVLAITASMMMVSLIFMVMVFAKLHVPTGTKKMDLGSEKDSVATSKLSLIIGTGLLWGLNSFYGMYEIFLYLVQSGFRNTKMPPNDALYTSRWILNAVYFGFVVCLLIYSALSFATTYRVAVNTGAIRPAPVSTPSDIVQDVAKPVSTS